MSAANLALSPHGVFQIFVLGWPLWVLPLASLCVSLLPRVQCATERPAGAGGPALPWVCTSWGWAQEQEWGRGEHGQRKAAGSVSAKSGRLIRVGWMERVPRKEGSWAWDQNRKGKRIWTFFWGLWILENGFFNMTSLILIWSSQMPAHVSLSGFLCSESLSSSLLVLGSTFFCSIFYFFLQSLDGYKFLHFADEKTEM